MPTAAQRRQRKRELTTAGVYRPGTGADLKAEQELEQQRQKQKNLGSLPEAVRLGNDLKSEEVATALYVNTKEGRELIGALLSEDPPASWKELMNRVNVNALERILYVDAKYWNRDMTHEDTFNEFHKKIEDIDSSRIQKLRKILSTMGGRKVKPWYKFIW